MTTFKNKKIDLYRSVDFWVGMPICFLLTAAHKMCHFLGLSKNRNDTVKKILFIKPSEMGGIILSYPLIQKIREKHPNSELYFLTFKKNKPLFEILDIIPQKNIYTINDDSIKSLLIDTLRTIRTLRKKEIDMVFDLEFFSRFTAIISFLITNKKRVGFYKYTMEGLYRGELFTHKIQYNPLLHISNMYLSMSQDVEQQKKHEPTCNQEISNEKLSLPNFSPNQEQINSMKNRLKKYGFQENDSIFLLNPGEGTIPLREWGLENFVIIAKHLLQKKKKIIIVGTESGGDKTENLLKELGENTNCLNLCGQTSLTELLTLCHFAETMLINDCGLSHLAALTGIKQIILFGPESPKIFSPLSQNAIIIYTKLTCSPCLSAFNHRRSRCTDNICLKSILPDEIIKKFNF